MRNWPRNVTRLGSNQPRDDGEDGKRVLTRVHQVRRSPPPLEPTTVVVFVLRPSYRRPPVIVTTKALHDADVAWEQSSRRSQDTRVWRGEEEDRAICESGALARELICHEEVWKSHQRQGRRYQPHNVLAEEVTCLHGWDHPSVLFKPSRQREKSADEQDDEERAQPVSAHDAGKCDHDEKHERDGSPQDTRAKRNLRCEEVVARRVASVEDERPIDAKPLPNQDGAAVHERMKGWQGEPTQHDERLRNVRVAGKVRAREHAHHPEDPQRDGHAKNEAAAEDAASHLARAVAPVLNHASSLMQLREQLLAHNEIMRCIVVAFVERGIQFHVHVI